MFDLRMALGAADAVGAGAQEAQFPISRAHETGKGKSIILLGTHAHHPSKQTTASPPRVRDIEATRVR